MRSLFDAIDTVILTSARWPWRRDSNSPSNVWDCASARTLVVPSHFDYEKQALLYVPQTSAGSAQSGVYAGGGRRDRRDADAQPRPRVRAVHQLSADASDLRSRLAGNPLSRR